MRNEQEFEKLVFERAEKIKAHDRRLRVIRTSLMPIAAAFVILTAVGLNGAFSVKNSSAMPDAAANDYSAYNEDFNAANGAKTAAPENAPAAALADEQAEDNSIDGFENFAEDEYTQGDLAADGTNYSSKELTESDFAVKITFTANSSIELTSPEKTSRVLDILGKEPTNENFDDTGYRGTLTVTDENGRNDDYLIYKDHISAPNGNLILDESDRQLLSEYFNIAL